VRGGVTRFKIIFCRFHGGSGLPAAVAERACRVCGSLVLAAWPVSLMMKDGHHRSVLFTHPDAVDRGDIASGGGADGEGACPLPCLYNSHPRCSNPHIHGMIMSQAVGGMVLSSNHMQLYSIFKLNSITEMLLPSGILPWIAPNADLVRRSISLHMRIPVTLSVLNSFII
jgi:hypothetical protein